MSFPSVPPGYFDDDIFWTYWLPCGAMLLLAIATIAWLAIVLRREVAAGAASYREVLWPKPSTPRALRVAVAQVLDQFHLPLIFYGAVAVLSRLLPGGGLTVAFLLWLFVAARLGLWLERQWRGSFGNATSTYIVGALILGLIVLATIVIGLPALVVLWPFLLGAFAQG
jgi:hypothetical protein